MSGPIGFFIGFLIFGTGVILDQISKSRRLTKIEKWIERHDYQQNILMLMPGAQVGSMTSPGELGKLLGSKEKP